jgi:hypothetical protein
MTAHSGQSRKREAAIAALLVSPTIAHAAQSAAISESTLTRWLRDEGFLASYRTAQRQALQQAIAALQAAAGVAVTVLRAAMLDQSATPAARVAAARAVLEFGFRGAEIADIEERLAVVEAELAKADTDSRRS